MDRENEAESSTGELVVDVDDDLQNELCRLWDMSMNSVSNFHYFLSLFLKEKRIFITSTSFASKVHFVMLYCDTHHECMALTGLNFKVSPCLVMEMGNNDSCRFHTLRKITQLWSMFISSL